MFVLVIEAALQIMIGYILKKYKITETNARQNGAAYVKI
jgi:hypothetical protein